MFLNDKEEKFFGEGPYQLLKKVEETGSLHAAAMTLGMAYSKATKLLHNAEVSLGFPLTVRKIGGKSGGGSVLTEEAKDFMARYAAYKEDCLEYGAKQYDKYFGKQNNQIFPFGCVIMASGMGKRFGGDKLMTQMLGKPMIQYIIEATENLFLERVVVTRNMEVKAWCENRGISVVFHTLPGRNDTIRLGLEALEAKCGNEKILGCAFCPADMPFVTKTSLKLLLTNAEKSKAGIIRMSHKGKVGAPVLFGKEFFSLLQNLPEGKGGSEIIKEHQEKVSLIEVKEDYELWDLDTKEDFQKIENKMKEIFF